MATTWGGVSQKLATTTLVVASIADWDLWNCPCALGSKAIPSQISASVPERLVMLCGGDPASSRNRFEVGKVNMKSSTFFKRAFSIPAADEKNSEFNRVSG